jgi:hypothetical protein
MGCNNGVIAVVCKGRWNVCPEVVVGLIASGIGSVGFPKAGGEPTASALFVRQLLTGHLMWCDEPGSPAADQPVAPSRISVLGGTAQRRGIEDRSGVGPRLACPTSIGDGERQLTRTIYEFL